MHRYTFTGPGKRLVRIDARHSVGDWCHPTEVSLELNGRELAGYRQVDGWASGRRIYLSATFSERFEDAVEEAPGVMLFCFPEGTKEVTLYAGLSGVDAEGARANRLAEMSGIDFDSAVKRASARWNQALGAIEVKGGPADVFSGQSGLEDGFPLGYLPGLASAANAVRHRHGGRYGAQYAGRLRLPGAASRLAAGQ